MENIKKPEITRFDRNPGLDGLAVIKPSFVYSPEAGEEARMIVMKPQKKDLKGAPLVVFVQGSGFTTGDPWYEIPQLCALARRGFVVATVNHRSMRTVPFPAYVRDVKCAIRYLRANAAEYGIDPKRVCVFGTSSGGNTALTVGLTGDDPAYGTDEYADESDTVQLVVECFGPTDMIARCRLRETTNDYSYFLGPDRAAWEERLKAVSPLYLAREGADYPPFLLLHGTADTVVPLWQTEKMYDRLLECGADAHLVLVDGADHEGDFWSPALWDYIFDYIGERL